MFVHFSLHGLHASCSEELYLQYSGRYPNETKVFAYYNRTNIRLVNGSIVGAIAGVSVSIPTYFLANSFVNRASNLTKLNDDTSTKPSKRRKNRKDHSGVIAGLAVFVFYEIVFIVASFLMNPFFLTTLTDLGYSFVYAMLCFFILAVYIHMKKISKEIRYFPEKDYLDWKRLELELLHAGSRQYLYMLSWMGVMIFAAVVFVMISQGFYAMPLEISSTPTFNISMTTSIVWNFAIFLGFFGGIVCQFILSIVDIEETIRKYYTERSKKITI